MRSILTYVSNLDSNHNNESARHSLCYLCIECRIFCTKRIEKAAGIVLTYSPAALVSLV